MRRPKTNFLRQGFRKLSHYRQTYRQMPVETLLRRFTGGNDEDDYDDDDDGNIIDIDDDHADDNDAIG